MGIAEANMIGTAAGIALAGKRPFICSFAVFVTGRYDTIRMSVCYNQANVKIIGTHAGLGTGEDGNSQQGLEDVNLMRGLPHMEVFQPCDGVETKAIMNYLAKSDKPAYLRLTRHALPYFHDSESYFKPGKADVLREGESTAIFATGGMTSIAMETANHLASQGKNVAVVNFHTIKPLDLDLISEYGKKFPAIFTMEDHNTIGGLGSAIAEAVSETNPTKVIRIGLQDQFGESGQPAELYQKHGMDVQGASQTILKHIQ